MDEPETAEVSGGYLVSIVQTPGEVIQFLVGCQGNGMPTPAIRVQVRNVLPPLIIQRY